MDSESEKLLGDFTTGNQREPLFPFRRKLMGKEVFRGLTHLLQCFSFLSFLLVFFLTALTLIRSKNNYDGRVLRLAEENLHGVFDVGRIK